MTQHFYLQITFFHKLAFKAVNQAFAILHSTTRKFGKAHTIFLFVAQQNFVMFIYQ
jgi:hypothetical protein